MDESEDNMNSDEIIIEINRNEKEKPKKRSLVERELETSLTSYITSPITAEDGTTTSRFGRARRLKNNTDFCDTDKSVTSFLKSSQYEKSPNIKAQPTSPVYKMQASNSLIHETSPKSLTGTNLENQIENIYNTNVSLSRFGSDEKNDHSQSPAKKFSKTYVRKDLIQSKEKDDPVTLIRHMFSPTKSTHKSNNHLSNILERSSEKYDLCNKTQNGYLDTSSVVKTLDFDCSKKKRKDRVDRETKSTFSKSDLFDLEAKCEYQVGDIAWARMGTFPFWPCIITREPGTEIFVRVKLFGKVEHNIIHVTFFGDNGRRSWILDSMLRKYQGLAEFETTRDQFTPEAKKKDPKLYAAFFISEKKLVFWHAAIDEADMLQREPKRLRMDLLYELLGLQKVKHTPLKNQKSGKVTRTDSDVSLSETLYDSLFSGDDGKTSEAGNKKNKSLDVSEVVTACLDNMAAKTGMTMIQRQSHMDIWLQKAKSKTPEKMNITVTVERLENESKSKSKERDTRKSKSQDRDSSKKKKKALPREVPIRKPYSFRKSTESQNLLSYHNEHDYSKNIETGNNADNIDGNNSNGNILNDAVTQCDNNPICVIDKVESLRNLEATPESRDGVTNKEIQEEIVIDTDHLHDDKIPAEQGNKGDTEVVITQTKDVKVNDVIKENESISIDLSDNSEQNCDQLNATETETYNVEVPITEHANKTTNAFILQTDTQDAKTTSLEQQNLLKTDDKPYLKEPEETCAQKRNSSRMIDNMSIDEDAMICGSSHETSQIFFNTVTDKQNKSENSLLEQLNQQNSIYEKEKNESYQITSTNDMSVDDIPEKTSETLCNSIKELKEYNDDNKVSVTKECLSTLDNCEQGLLPKLYDRGTDNNSEITTNESKNQTGVVTLISKEEMIKEKSTDIPASQAENLNTSELVPKKKLAVIKEANIGKFRNTSIIKIPRRSLRKSGSKKEKQHKPMKEPEFLQYLELRQDAIVDEYPELSQDEIVEYLYKTWQFGSNVHQTHISDQRKSPSDFKKIEDIEFISESHIQEFKGDNSKEDSEVEISKLSVEPNTSNKRSLRLRKSQSPSVPKKREHEQQSNKVITTNTDSILNTVDAISSSNAKVLKHEPENSEEISVNNFDHISATQTQENNNLEFENSTTAEEVTDINRYKDKLLSPTGFIVKDVTPAEDVYLLTSKKPGLSLRIPKAAFEPKVLLERKKEMHDRQDKDTQIKSDKKLPTEKEIKTITDEEIKIDLSNPETKSMRRTQRSKSYLVSRNLLEDNNVETERDIKIAQPNLETKPLKRSHRSKSYLLSRNVLEDNNENIEKQDADGNDSATTSGKPTGSETLSENKTSLIKDTERDTNLDTPRAKSRSLRLRKSQSPSESAKSKQEQNTQSDFSEVADLITENKSNINELSSSDNIANVGDILASQNESSNIITTSVVNKCTNEHSNKTNIIDRTLVDNISLASDLTNGFADHSSDIDFDPDTISLNSMSSEISYNSELLPKIVKVKSEKQNMIQNLLESDNESISSLDDVALSELKKRSQKEETAKILSHSIENSMDSIKSDSSEKRLRLVLTDCLLDAKDSKLPVIKEVSSKTNEEFEISQSRSEISTPNRLVLSKSPVEPKVNGYSGSKAASPELKVLQKIEDNMPDPDTLSIKSSGSEASVKRKGKKQDYKPMEEPEFLKYLEMRQDALIDEHPEVTPSEIAAYLYKTWQYEESLKSDIKKNDDIESANLVKGVNQVIQEPPKKKKGTTKKLINIEKIMAKSPKIDQFVSKNIEQRELPKRKVSKAFYKEDYSDIEEEIEMFEIFNTKKKQQVKIDAIKKETHPSEAFKVKEESDSKSSPQTVTLSEEKVEKTIDIKDEAIIDLDNEDEVEEHCDEVESYFEQLTNPKPNVFKGLIREKICEICEKPSNLVKCKGCSGMFHVECVRKEIEIVDTPVPTRGRKKKKKPRGRKPKSSLDSNEEGHSDEKSHDHNVSEENMSIDDVSAPGPIIIPDAENFESQLEAKMKEMIETVDKIEYDSYSSDDGTDWTDTVAGKCEIVDVKPKIRPLFVNTDDFKCKNCQKDDTPICFVCKSPVSPKNNIERRQKCQVAHCHKYYHLECLEQWPQTQFKGGEPSRNNKKIDEHFEALACPRHVCHTCVCDDPRGCKTRFSGDKLARCVRCPATYHSFTKCLPAGSQILSASHIVCPRHYEHRPGKIPYHVNTGWCFICALGGNLICCDYCPTSFHADCLNIEPPEGGYMCEDCETGRLPLYGEMVWVKLGHYRWWPGIVLHPLEIPDNIMAVKHSPGEFVVRFFGQYDHYWVNRGRVFPFQEGDSGRISTQKSKIDEAFTIAMEDAQRAFEILKNIEPNDEENQDIQSSLLPPHYVKLKVNKPCGSLYGKKIDIEESSLTQCDCNPDEEEPCGPYSHCLNRMLLTECGPHCRAGERCQNRAFEKRLYPKLVPYRTSQRGWGLKTLEPIKAGQFVIEYVGELIDETEFRRRMQRKHDTRDENFYFLTLDKERMIDAGPKGNLARFMNHCCEPNCETQKWTVLGDVRVGLFAIHDIPANTEVTFNYNLECTGIEKKPCMCGARRCAGYIGAKPKQEEPQPKKLKLAVKRAYKKRKNTEVQSPSTSKLTKPKRPVGRPAKPRELTDIEKDLLIIKNATNGISSDSEGSSRLSSLDDNTAKALKRKRVSFSTEETVIYNGHSPSVKKMKIEDIDKTEVGD